MVGSHPAVCFELLNEVFLGFLFDLENGSYVGYTNVWKN